MPVKRHFLACAFCFPISDHVMVLQRTVFFFKFRLMHVHPRVYVCIIHEKTKGKFSGEHHDWSVLRKQNITFPASVGDTCTFFLELV